MANAAAAQPKTPGPLPVAWVYAAGLQCTATALVFFLTAVIKLPVLLYFPLSRRWSLTATPDELSMDFYGRSLLAIAAGVLAFLVTLAFFAARREPKNIPSSDDRAKVGRNLALIAGYAATAVIFAILIYAYELYGRAPVPEPLPSGMAPIERLPGPAPSATAPLP